MANIVVDGIPNMHDFTEWIGKQIILTDVTSSGGNGASIIGELAAVSATGITVHSKVVSISFHFIGGAVMTIASHGKVVINET